MAALRISVWILALALMMGKWSGHLKGGSKLKHYLIESRLSKRDRNRVYLFVFPGLGIGISFILKLDRIFFCRCGDGNFKGITTFALNICHSA